MATPPLLETELSPRALALTLGGDGLQTSFGANCLAFRGANGSLVVDPLVAPAHARLVADALARRGWPPVTDVALTHHHTDHALGAGWFAARGARVVAHRRAADAIAAQHGAIVAERRRIPELAALFADAEPYRPSAIFDDAHEVDLGDVRAEVRHLGSGHTPGDAIVILPSEDLVATGDLVFRGFHFNYEEADLAALPHRLAELAALPWPMFVPGHGAPGGREILDEQRRYHAEVRRIVKMARDDEDARTAIRARFPEYGYEPGIESALAAFGR